MLFQTFTLFTSTNQSTVGTVIPSTKVHDALSGFNVYLRTTSQQITVIQCYKIITGCRSTFNKARIIVVTIS